MLDAARVGYATAFASSDSGTQYVARDSSSFSDLLKKLGGQNSVAKLTAMDPWGNIRIPNLRRLPGYDAADPQRWVEVAATNLTNYSSLVGVPVGGLPAGSDENFTYVIGSKYHFFEASCPIYLMSWCLKILTNVAFATVFSVDLYLADIPMEFL